MSLNDTDKAAVKTLWGKMAKSTEPIGTNALARLFACFPQCKTYFSHWPSMDPNSDFFKRHGKIICEGVGLAVSNIDNINAGLLSLSEKHAFELRVDPANFKLMAHCLLVVIATMFPKDLTPEVHMAFDKFMCCVAAGLSERFR